MSVWGIDPSTKRVSCAVRGLTGDAWTVESVGVEGPAGSRLSLGFRRCLSFFRAMDDDFHPDAVWVEQPSGAYRNLPLTYMVGVVIAAVGTALPGTPVYTVPPSSWKMAVFGKGKGNADKSFIMAWARELGYAGMVQDEADALGIATGGTLLTPKSKHVKVICA